MSCMQLYPKVNALLDSYRALDARTRCVIVAGVLVAVLPLEMQHLLAALVGAAIYMILQALEPRVQRRKTQIAPKKESSLERTTPPWRAAAISSQAEKRKQANVRSSTRSQAPPPAPVVKAEVRKPSAMPVQAPTFQASGWEEEVVELLQSIMPSKASKAAVAAIARSVKLALSPDLRDAEVDGFACANPLGRAAFGVAVPEVEIVVTVNPKLSSMRSMDAAKLQKSLIRSCTDSLVNQGAFKFRRSAFRGAEPRVTLMAPATLGLQEAIPINLSVNASSPARCAALFEACCQLDRRAAAVVLLVRRWAKDRGVSHAAKGHLSPYSWMLMAIYYLQVSESQILPPLASLIKDASLPEKVASDTSPSAAELFKGFFDFYANLFDWRNEAVSVKLGKRSPPDASLPVHILLHEDGRTTQVGNSLEDPFESKNNLADSMNWLSMRRLHEELARAHELCGREVSLAEVLEPWSPPEVGPEE